MSLRPIKHLVRAEPTMEGAGVHLHRAFGFRGSRGPPKVPGLVVL